MLHGAEEVAALEQRIADTGYYSHRCSPDEEAALRADPDAAAPAVRAADRRADRSDGWRWPTSGSAARTACRCYINAGNDDPPEVDAVIDAAERVEFLEGRVVELPNGIELASCGYANKTPWNCPRDVEEPSWRGGSTPWSRAVEDPEGRCSTSTARRTTPRSTRGRVLGEDFRLRQTAGGIEMHPVGSTACRAVIEREQPLMGLHGHLHESRGTFKLGRTVCINPGSEYTEGILRGALIDVHDRKRKVKNCVLTTG